MAVASNKISMKTRMAVLVLWAGIGLLRADDATANVQQALKEQGFYYGEISGEKNADTVAAIRRFQIRNGLQVTGELNEETLRALGAGNNPRPVAKATPDTSDLRSEPNEEEDRAPVNSTRPPNSPRSPDQPLYPGRLQPAPSENGPLFAGTPYENAPPEVQRNVVSSAQNALARRGLYRGAIDGVYGPNMEFSLRAYQSRVGIHVTGRLDLETLAALELLPGAHAPVYVPRRRVGPGPPIHGEWVPEH